MNGEAGVHWGVEYGNLEIWVRWITVEKKCCSCLACSRTVEYVWTAVETVLDPAHLTSYSTVHYTLWTDMIEVPTILAHE